MAPTENFRRIASRDGTQIAFWVSGDGAPPLLVTVIDRLTFKATIIETGTESWRFKKSLEKQMGRGNAGQ